MGFVYRVVRVLEALWIVLSETIKVLRKLHKTNIFGMPPTFYHRVMYIAPSSGHILLNVHLPLKLIKEVCSCFLMSGVRMLHLFTDWWKFLQIHQYYTMALKFKLFISKKKDVINDCFENAAHALNEWRKVDILHNNSTCLRTSDNHSGRIIFFENEIDLKANG